VPPRYAYWTILIDDKPTAFRAREREELQPTFVQLQRKNPNVTMKWFARGKLWASREAERDDFQMQRNAAMAPRDQRDERGEPAERRRADWRPGGAHKDPRDRFKKKNRPERAWSEKDPATQRDRDKPGYAASKPRGEWRDKPVGPARGDRPWQKPDAARGDRPWSKKPDVAQGFSPAKPRGDRPWSAKPPSGERKPWRDKPAGDARRPGPFGPGEKRPWSGKPSDRSGPPRGDRPPAHRSSSDRRPSGSGWSGKPATPNDRPWQTKPTGPRAQRKPWIPKSDAAPRGDRPWSNKPAGGPPRGDRPWSGKPSDRSGPPRERKPWSGKPAGDGRRPGPSGPGEKRPWSGKPRGPRPGGAPPRKRRDDEPDKD
jgi:23S rRNA pseudouridine2605 synthase